MMNNIQLEKLLLASNNNKYGICMSVCDFTDIIKMKGITKENNLLLENFHFNVAPTETGICAKINESIICCLPIVAEGNIRLAKVAQPITKYSDLRKLGDENVMRTIEENWSEEIELAKYEVNVKID